MSAADNLLGPPEIHHHLPSSSTTSTTPGDGKQPPMGLTENSSPTFLSSGDPCLDFFFQIVPDTPADAVTDLLTSAWDQDPLTALKLVCHLRGVRGTGKSDRKGFYAAALWLHDRHPKTLALNVDAIADFGYMKDLPEILQLIVAGRRKGKQIKTSRRFRIRKVGRSRRNKGRQRTPFRSRRKVVRPQKEGTTEERLAAEMSKVKIRVEEAATVRRQNRYEMAVRAAQRYASDPDYRFLHDRISDYFAALLSSDIKRLESGKVNHISLAAKWCPSLDSSYDRSTLLCESIARRVFPRGSHPEYSEIEEQHYAYRVRDRLRKEVLVPLRKALELPEVYISAGQWGSLPYSRVASVAMKNYKAIFLEHDPERFREFLDKVKKGEAKIAAGALLPHEILAPAVNGEDDEVAELQWRRMVSDLSERGKLRNCIAVCDVSGSMTGTPMEVCVALGMLISELSEEPWKGRVITFSENPEIHQIKGESLREKAKFVQEMDWGANTDFQKVFDRILSVAVEGKLEADKMIKKVFVFSDMEFDEASGRYQWEMECDEVSAKSLETDYQGNVEFDEAPAKSCESESDEAPAKSCESESDEVSAKSCGSAKSWDKRWESCGSAKSWDKRWETDYQVICRKFKENGYESAVPDIVFWNLRNSRSTPVPSGQKGVALVSGFSKNLVTPFLEGNGVLSPKDVMEIAIAGKEYTKLVVFD